MSIHPETELLQLGAERERLAELRKPISEQANRLSEVVVERWRAEGNGASLDDPAGLEAYRHICDRVGLLTAEGALGSLDEQIFPLDHKIRAIPAGTIAGLKVKFDLLSCYIGGGYADDIPREEQDFDVCLFNELADEFRRLTAVSPIMTLFREWEAKYAEAGDEAKTTDKQSSELLDQCRVIELQMMVIPITDAADIAAKLIVATSYGDFVLPDRGKGGLIDEAEAILTNREGGSSCG